MYTLEDNLRKALGDFLEVMRDYIATLLLRQRGQNWPRDFRNQALTAKQQKDWDYNIEEAPKPETLIDFHHLHGFANAYQSLIKKDLGFKEAKILPGQLEEIAQARHDANHYQAMEASRISRTFETMILILEKMKKTAAAESIRQLSQPPTEPKPQSAAPSVAPAPGDKPLPWFQVLRPHLDIRQGRLDETVFAADLAQVAQNQGRQVYANAAQFFEKTYFTQGLRNVARRVVQGLNGQEDGENRVISLQTGFGGGKTHTLISLFHLAKAGRDASQSGVYQKLLESVGEPKFEQAHVAVFTNKTNDPVQGREPEEGLKIYTLWGELAYQLGGKEAYALIEANDQARTAPKGLFQRVLAQCQPALILIDELADYCVSAAAINVGKSTLADQTISFMQELTEAVSNTPQTVLVATLPASKAEVSNSEIGGEMLYSLSQRLTRVGADTKPVADDEIFSVIRYRLFDNLGDEALREATISAYLQLYEELRGELPSQATRLEYKELLRKAYPFHPELIDLFRVRWASHHGFQRTRGVLRLLGGIVSDLWQRQDSLKGPQGLIHPSDVNFTNLEALRGQMTSLFGAGYDAVLGADVSGASSNAFQIDQDKPEYGASNLTRGLAATILLGTFGSDGPNRGLTVEQLKLAVLKPHDINHNSVNGALDALEAQAYYLYYASSGSGSKRYWFHTKPNINILVSKVKAEVSQRQGEIRQQVVDRFKKASYQTQGFRLLIDPGQDIAEQKTPTLVVLNPQYQVNGSETKVKEVIQQIATRRGNSSRVYKNTLLFLVASEQGYRKLADQITEVMACEKIQVEYRGQLEKDQSSDILGRLNEANQKIERLLGEAYANIYKYTEREGLNRIVAQNWQPNLRAHLEKNVYETLREEEWLLESVGLALLQKVNLFPEPGAPRRTKEMYEAFIQFDTMPLLTKSQALADSLRRYCEQGLIGIAIGAKPPFETTYLGVRREYIPVEDETTWVIHPDDHQVPEPATDTGSDSGGQVKPTPIPTPIGGDNAAGNTVEDPIGTVKKFKTLRIHGHVDVANWHQLFTSFIMPLKDNHPEIVIEIKARSTGANPIDENSPSYKITKESAQQLGLDFRAEE